jgi:hypothetical protein
LSDNGRAPAFGDSENGEVPETETTGTGSEAPAGGGAAMSPGDVEPATVMGKDKPRPPEIAEDIAVAEVDAPRPSENVEDVTTAEVDAPRLTKAATDAEVPQV